MNLEQALKRIAELEQESNKLKNESNILKNESKNLKSENKKLENENKKLERESKKSIKEYEAIRLELFELNLAHQKVLLELLLVKEKHQVERIRRFVPKTEKINIMINEPEAVIKESKVSNPLTKAPRRSIFDKVDFERLVTETRFIDADEHDCPTCHSSLVFTSEKCRYQVEAITSEIKVIKLIKRTKKCPLCNKTDHKLYYPLAHEVFPGSILTPSFASYIAYHKYELGIPFHHLQTHFNQTLGLPISKSNMADYMAKTATLLSPIFHKMKEDLLHNETKVIHADETTLVVSKSSDVSRKKSYVYVFSPSFFERKQMQLYEFHETRKIDPISSWLTHYEGYLVCDDYPGYDKLATNNKGITLQKCWAHVRRPFADIVKSLDQKQRASSEAYQVLNLISILFDIEKDIFKQKDKRLILEIRKTRSLPIINKLRAKLDSLHPKPSSSLASAVNYANKNWKDLLSFLNHPYLELTNNRAERAVKPFVVQRKVFQTSGSYAGARYTTILFSMIRSAVINGLDVQKYLTYVITNINIEPLESLLPYSEKMIKLFKPT